MRHCITEKDVFTISAPLSFAGGWGSLALLPGKTSSWKAEFTDASEMTSPADFRSQVSWFFNQAAHCHGLKLKSVNPVLTRIGFQVTVLPLH